MNTKKTSQKVRENTSQDKRIDAAKLEQLILVNEDDVQIGIADKIDVHITGARHRAFSILIFNNEGKLLIQQRALTKYHSGGLWANSCCGHPRPKEKLNQAVHRRLKEELNFDCKLKKRQSFIYKVTLKNDLIENEYLHIFFGKYSGKVHANIHEVMKIKWVEITKIKKEIKTNPHKYAPWFKLILNRCFPLTGFNQTKK